MTALILSKNLDVKKTPLNMLNRFMQKISLIVVVFACLLYWTQKKFRVHSHALNLQHDVLGEEEADIFETRRPSLLSAPSSQTLPASDLIT